MPNMPCYASIAAADYAETEAAHEEYNNALAPFEDEICETWTVGDLHTVLKPHEQEVIDAIVAQVAEKLLASAVAWHNEP